MLQRMREGVQGWIAWLIISALVLSLLLWGISSYFHASGSAKLNAAEVNGHAITLQEVNMTYARTREQQGAKPISAVEEKKLRKKTLDNLIKYHLMVGASKAMGFYVSQAQVNDVISQNPSFQVNDNFSQDLFHMILNRMGLTPTKYSENIHNNLMLTQLQSGLSDTTFILPPAITQMMQLLQQKRSFRYLTIPPNHFAKKVSVSKKEISDYYAKHKKDFLTTAKVKINYLSVSRDEIKKQLKPTEAQLKAFYQANLNNYTQAPRWHIAHIIVRVDSVYPKAGQAKLKAVKDGIKAKKSFAELAKKYSDDPFTNNEAGDMGWLDGFNTAITSIKTQLATMKVGDISKPIKTPTGYKIVKLLGKEDKKVSSYKKVADTVKKAYVSQESEKHFNDIKAQLSDLTAQTPDSLKPIAKQVKLPLQSTDWFDKTGLKKGIAKNSKVIDAAFDDVNIDGDNSDVINVSPTQAVVLRVVEHQAAKAKTLAAATKDIKAKLTTEKEKQKTAALGKTILATIDAKPADYAKIAKKNGLKWKTVTNIQRHDKKVDKAILDKAFDMTKPVKGAANSIGFTYDKDDYAIVTLTKVEDNTKDSKDPQQRSIYRQELENTYAELALKETIDHFHKKAKINIIKH